jgi:uncharacterized protein (DUF1499 family)
LDPEFQHSTGKPNEYRLQIDISAISAKELIRRIDGFVQQKTRVKYLAGSPDDLMITYIERTRLIGYPDYITIKVIPIDPDNSKLSIYSRSRFGHSDLGINKRRVDEWSAAIQGMVAR